MIENGHKYADFRLIREVNKPQYLDAFENLYIYKTKRTNMNIQNAAQIISPLFNFTTPITTGYLFEGKT